MRVPRSGVGARTASRRTARLIARPKPVPRSCPAHRGEAAPGSTCASRSGRYSDASRNDHEEGETMARETMIVLSALHHWIPLLKRRLH